MNLSKTILLMLLSVGSISTSYAQITLTGKVVDAQQAPLVSATLSLNIKDSTKTYKYALSDTTGYFIFEVSANTYTLTVNYVGIAPFSKEVVLRDSNVNIGTLLTAESDSKTLKGVTVTAKKPLIEQKIDRLVFNVENSIAATGGDALDALKVTPRLKVQNDQISMIGKSGMRVMVNDVLVQVSGEDLINYLKSIRSSDIKSIEVITNPPAKYSAEGNSGIINIKLKKTQKDTWNASINSFFRQNTYSSGGLGGSYNLQKNKLTLNANIDVQNSNALVNNHSVIDYSNSTWEVDALTKNARKILTAKLGLDYQINDKWSAGFQYQFNTAPYRGTTHTLTHIFNTQHQLDSLVKTDAGNPETVLSHTFNYHTIYVFDSTGKKLTLDFDFFDFKDEQSTNFATNSYQADGSIKPNTFVGADNNGKQNINNYSVNLDMEHPTHWATLNYGARLSFIKTDNNFNYYDLSSGSSVFDPNQSNRFIYTENTQALYASAQKKIGDKWETKIGLRYENTQTKGYSATLNTTTPLQYNRLFPTAYLKYAANASNDFSLNYGRRISRPDYSDLNPFKIVLNPYYYLKGNPFLQPSFNHNIEFTHSYKDILVSTVSASYLNNDFAQVIDIDPTTKIQSVIPQNYLSNQTYGLNETLNLSPLPWLKGNINANVFYSATQSTLPITVANRKGWTGIFSASADVVFNQAKTVLLNLSYGYISKGVSALAINEYFYQIDATLKVLALKKKLQIGLQANDIFKSSRQKFIIYSNGIKNTFGDYYDNRYLRLSLTYSFGKSFDRKEHSNKNQTEIDRAH